MVAATRELLKFIIIMYLILFWNINFRTPTNQTTSGHPQIKYWTPKNYQMLDTHQLPDDLAGTEYWMNTGHPQIEYWTPTNYRTILEAPNAGHP